MRGDGSMGVVINECLEVVVDVEEEKEEVRFHSTSSSFKVRKSRTRCYCQPSYFFYQRRTTPGATTKQLFYR